jgi:beta-alanine degradation protein BauB
MAKRTAAAPDPVAVDPEAYKVLFENEKVRVLEFRDKPGDQAKMHIHPERLIYSFTAWKRKFLYPDGRSELAEGKAGEVKWTAPVIHAGENIGETETHNLFIEFKDQPGERRGTGPEDSEED